MRIRTRLDCLPCFLNQGLKAARICTPGDEELHRTVLRRWSSRLAEVDIDRSPPAVAGDLYRDIAPLLRTNDPFYQEKKASNCSLFSYPTHPGGGRAMRDFLVDTHVHLCDPSFRDDLEDVLGRARQAGVGAMIAVSETLDDVRRTRELAGRYSEVLPAAGLYPGEADRDEAAAVAEVVRTERSRLAAIGEVGLDFRIAESEEDRQLQREVFSRFIALALELDLPLNVHSRSAGRQTIELLLEKGARRVQMHAFDGKAGSAKPGLEAGFLFSVPPSIVRSRQKQKLITNLPLSSLLLETDAPVLGPSPGERNEPANLPVALRMVAGIKGIPEDQVRQAVQENTLRLYGEGLLSRPDWPGSPRAGA